MRGNRRAAKGIEATAAKVLKILRQDQFVSQVDMARRARASGATTKRSFDWLKKRNAPISYVPARRAWTLLDKSFVLPEIEPSVADIQLFLTAAGLLRELGHAAAAQRADALLASFAEDVPDHQHLAAQQQFLRVTLSRDLIPNPEWMLLLLRCAQRRVVELTYRSPWQGEATTLQFEPWALWLHDGSMYVRGYSRLRSAPRTFRLAHIVRIAIVEGASPIAVVDESPWGTQDPRYGVDDDRGGTARVTFSGPVARWVAASRWHPAQVDHLRDDDVLERELPFGSCRELARRLAGVADGLVSVDPPELADALVRLLREGARRIGPAVEPLATEPRPRGDGLRRHDAGVVSPPAPRPPNPRRSPRDGRRPPASPPRPPMQETPRHPAGTIAA